MAPVTLGLAIVFAASAWMHWSSQEGAAPDGEPAFSGSQEAASAVPALAGFPNVAVAYYDIDATEPEAIRAQIAERGPRFKGEQFAALTTWHYRWRWDAAPGGGCGTANAKVTLETKVLLPRLVHLDSVDPQVAQAWRSYFDALARHEAGHVRLAADGRTLVADAVRLSACREANSAGESAVDVVGKGQAEYDRRTLHGRREGVVFAI
jgi:predicted secreted Zn-dependent protease